MRPEHKPPLVIIAGATATGKTALAVDLAEKIGGEIISADSMQIYKYMDIGTAKPTKEEMRGVPHHLVDELYPDEEYNVAVFQKMARKYADEIYARGHVPILTGGTGFYINAFLRGTEFTETETDYNLRQDLSDCGAENLYARLKEADPESAAAIHPNNVKRIIRALEYFAQTGEKISAHNARERSREDFYRALFFILDRDRAELYKRVEQRVDAMINAGLANEVARLLEMGYAKNLVSMQGLGYKEIVPFAEGEISLAQAAETLKINTRHFAKKQITWFKHQCSGEWINVDESVTAGVLLESVSSRYKIFTEGD